MNEQLKMYKVLRLAEAGGIWYHFTIVVNGAKFRTDAWFIEFGEGHDEKVRSIESRASRELCTRIRWKFPEFSLTSQFILVY